MENKIVIVYDDSNLLSANSLASSGAGSVGSAVASSGSPWGVLATAIDSGVDFINNERNISLQKETNAKNEGLTREQWSREDNAVQRRVADLKAAGLSPTLAAGSAAASGSPLAMQAPKSNLKGGYGAQTLAALKAVAELKQAAAGIELTNAQIEGQKISNDVAQVDKAYRQLEVDNFGLPWQLKAVNSILQHLNGKNLFETVNNIYTGFKDGPVKGFVTAEPPAFTDLSLNGDAVKSAVDSGAAQTYYESDGSQTVAFTSAAAAKQWFLDIGGTTNEWYYGVRKFGSPEGFLNDILGSGGWYFK